LVRLEAGRQLYNACLGEALKRVRLMRQSKAHARARKMPPGKERTRAFNVVNQEFHYSEYALHAYATRIRHSWIGEHIDSNTAQTLATRAFKASQRLLFGRAKRVRFKGKNQMDSLEGKTNKQGIRWAKGSFVWGDLKLSPLLKSNDPVILHGLNSRIKYVRLVRRKYNGKNRFYAQLVNEGKPLQKPSNSIGTDTIGLDLGPSTIAIVGSQEARLSLFAAELGDKTRQVRRLQRQIDRQRRANNPQNYNPNGTIKPGKKQWHKSQRQRRTETRLANIHRRLAAHRKSLHGRMANDILRQGHTIKTEKLSYRAFQKCFGKSVGLRAPGSFVSRLKQKAENAGGRLEEFPTRTTALSQTCHCGRREKKSLSQRVHQCRCGVVAQRDLYSAFLARFVEGEEQLLSIKQAQKVWSEGAERLLGSAWQQALINSQLNGRVPSSFGKLSELERVAPNVLVEATESPNVVPRVGGESGKGCEC